MTDRPSFTDAEVALPPDPPPEPFLSKRTRHLLEVAFVVFVGLVGVAAGVAIALLLSLSRTVKDQSDILARRSPTLAYLVCHDRRQDEFIIDLGDYVLSLIDAGPASNPRPGGAEDVAEARRELEAARTDLRHATDEDSTNPCPPLPDGLVDTSATTAPPPPTDDN